jgi:hypothetical protein
MNWKNWPYWVRGVIVGLLIFVILFVVYMLFSGHLPDWLVYIFLIPMFIPMIISGHVTPYFCTPTISNFLFDDCLITGVIIAVIFTFMELLICGALIGWFYGKIKSHHKPVVNGNNP